MMLSRLRSSLAVRGPAALRRAKATIAAETPTYSERMDKTGKPVSPHVFIYAFPTIAISSITVRITGGMATLGFFGVGGLALTQGGEAAIESVQSIVSYAPTAAKFSMAWVLGYQWFGSARHLYWDWTAKGFTNAQMLHSSYALGGGVTLLSLALAAYSMPPTVKSKK